MRGTRKTTKLQFLGHHLYLKEDFQMLLPVNIGHSSYYATRKQNNLILKKTNNNKKNNNQRNKNDRKILPLLYPLICALKVKQTYINFP